MVLFLDKYKFIYSKITFIYIHIIIVKNIEQERKKKITMHLLFLFERKINAFDAASIFSEKVEVRFGSVFYAF